MPIYEYICRSCGEEFEYLVMGRDDRATCPKCEGKEVQRMVSAASFKSSGGFRSSRGGDGCGSCSASSCAGCASGR